MPRVLGHQHLAMHRRPPCVQLRHRHLSGAVQDRCGLQEPSSACMPTQWRVHGVHPGLPVCRTDGVCVECSTASSGLCKEPTPVCDELHGECVARCIVDADCKGPTRPACGAAGVCVECTAANKSLCTGTRPGCFVSAGMCVASCTSDAQCTDPLWPACGPEGFCRQCSGVNTTRCSPLSPTCDTAVGLCVAAPLNTGVSLEGSGLTCATGRPERVAGVSVLLLGLGALMILAGRRRNRR